MHVSLFRCSRYLNLKQRLLIIVLTFTITVFCNNKQAMEKHRTISQFSSSRQMREGGGFLVRRPIGDKINTADPFLMLDHMGPVIYGPGEAVGAPDHPHRGFETVTYIIDGGMKHQDSAGNAGDLEPGWVQWMTAGSGVVHSEMPTDKLLNEGGRMEGFQLWVNLPKKDKMIKPRYQDTHPSKIPVVKSLDGHTTVKVIAGHCLGTEAVIETRTPILYLDVRVSKGHSFAVDIPSDHNTFVYVWRGAGYLGEEKKEAKMGDVVTLENDGNQFKIQASDKEDIYALVIGGVPIKEPIARYGPFVMNTKEEIEQAFHDYRSGKLGQIDGAEERFAKTRAAVVQQKLVGRTKEL